MPLRFELLRPASLAAVHWQRWSEIQNAEPALESPYFRPEFTQAVAQVRRDVEVAVMLEGSEAVGFFPFQRGPLNIGKPVGGKLSDYHSVIARSVTQIDATELLKACRLAGWDFDHLVTTQPSFEQFAMERGESPYLDLSQGYEAYVAGRRAAGSGETKEINRKLRKCEREQGPITFELDSDDESVLDLLMQWKSAQLKQNGLPDIFAFPWTTALLRNIHRNGHEKFSGLLTVLRLNDKPVSILFSLRAGPVVHGWIFAYDKELAPYSPGSILLLKMAEATQQHGISKIDLGKGTERYKSSLASAATPLWEGTVGRASPALWLRSGWRTARDWVSRSPLAGVSKVPARAIQPLREWFSMH
jgi:CelD/BcsL family acetyltransferase involved in cellulose biosynthesis